MKTHPNPVLFLKRVGQGLREHLKRGMPIVRSARSGVQAVGDGVEFVLSEDAQVGALGQVLPDEPVGVDCVDALLREVHQHAPGGSLYAEALGTQLAVHLLRRYATASFHEPSVRGCLSPEQRRRIVEYIDDRIHESLTLQTLASVVNLGPCNFMRRFRQSFGISPHAFVVERRVERARGLLQGRAMSVKEVAFTCGFADQSHMTRVFRASLNTTPSALQGVLYRTTNG
jgi:transcriptional regulator GlxA family with amidase domain